MIEAQWIGGPHDGQVIALEDDVTEVWSVVEHEPSQAWRDPPAPVTEIRAEHVAYPVEPGGSTGWVIRWHA